jgi:hypothetical protein
MISPEQFDKWRVVPRILIAAYGYMCFKITIWYMSMPDPSAEQTAFVSVVWGASAAWFNFYVNSGNSKE